VKGFNDDVLRQLLKFFLLKPGGRGIDLKPSLPKDAADLAAIDDRAPHIPYKMDVLPHVEDISYDDS
jgi:hypothetical protein